MEEPKKYAIFQNMEDGSGRLIEETNFAQYADYMASSPYHTVYIDTRFDARLRLFRMIQKKNKSKIN